MIYQFPLDDQIVCFDSSSEKLCVANRVGARILELHVAGSSQEDIGSTLFKEFDASQSQIDDDVSQFLQRWVSGDVVQFQPAQNHEPDTAYVPSRALQPVANTIIHLPMGSVTIQSESAVVIDLLRPMYQLTQSIVQTSRKVTLNIFVQGDRFPIVYNGHTLDTGISVEDTALICLGVINVLASYIEEHAISLHAAAVSSGDTSVLLAARGGSGKTTLTAYLVANGYKLINDDAIHLSTEPVKIVPIPVALSIKSGSWDVVAQWYPHLMQQAVYGPPDRRIRYLPPSDDQVCLNSVACSIVCFPRYRTGASTEVLAIDKATALSMLIESGCYLPKPVKPAQVQQLVDWARGLTFYTLDYSSVNEAEAAIRVLLGNGDSGLQT